MTCSNRSETSGIRLICTLPFWRRSDLLSPVYHPQPVPFLGFTEDFPAFFQSQSEDKVFLQNGIHWSKKRCTVQEEPYSGFKSVETDRLRLLIRAYR